MKQPLVSIIINNYNYGHFLSQAIDSALQQAYRPIEVIVVDDGSDDGSGAIMAGYQDAILPVIKENGGQASAMNVGFAHSTGELIIFLDADDRLLPHTAGKVVAAFQSNPEAAKIQYRLAIINADGERTGQTKPPVYKSMSSGDLRAKILCFPDDLCWQPTSGNAFRARVLRQIFPIPETAYRLCADYYLSNLTPLFGTVCSLNEIGGCYRVHNANSHHTTDINVSLSREIITRSNHTHHYIKFFAHALGLARTMCKQGDIHSVTLLAHRIVSLRLEPQYHPLPDDQRFALFRHAIRASQGRFDLSWFAKSSIAFWFMAAALAPRGMVKWLAKIFFYPEARGWLNYSETMNS